MTRGIDVPTVDPRWLLEAARGLLERAEDATSGRWPRAVALLTRQALEAAVDRRLAARDPAFVRCNNARAKLLCLRRLEDPAEALAVDHTWLALSHACHHRGYDLPPTAGELRGWIEAVEAFCARNPPKGDADERTG